MLPHDGLVDLKKYIKDVTVFLHPTFSPNKIVLSEEPFMFSRVLFTIITGEIIITNILFLRSGGESFL